MNTHCCQYYNSKLVWLTKLVIKLKKQKKTVFKTNFHSVVALTKSFAEQNGSILVAELNKKSLWNYRSPPDPVRHISKDQLDKLHNKKKKGVA